MKYEDTPLESGNKVQVLWNEHDNGFQIWERGIVTEINVSGFYLEMTKTGHRVFVSHSSKLWKKG